MDSKRSFLTLLQERNLEIHFMPIVRLNNRNNRTTWKTYAFEALVRGPEGHKLRSPYALFQAADAAGKRRELELLCIETALKHRSALPKDTYLFLNVGLSTYLSDAFMDLLLTQVNQGLVAEKLVVEVLEDEMPVASSFRERAQILNGCGIHVALDDLCPDAFSLRRLVEAGPVRFWKLDRSLLGQWSERSEVARNWLPWLSSAAKEMNIDIVIEGIENRHLKFLIELCDVGVTLGQGFLFGKPAILGPGLSNWRRGFTPMLENRQSEGGPALVAVNKQSDLLRRLIPSSILGRS